MLWWYWSILGLVLIGMEILTLGGLGNFYFLFFGMAALMVSGLSWGGIVEQAWLQWFLLGVLGFTSLLAMKKPLQNKAAQSENSKPVDSMVGETATVLEPLSPQGMGKVALRGSTWSARNAGTTTLEKDALAKIIRVEGLTLWIEGEPNTQEEQHVG